MDRIREYAVQVNIHEAKTHLPKLIQRALGGEEVIIAKRGQPLVRLVAIPGVADTPKLGTAPGLIRRMGDDFDDPPPDFAAYQ
ncbi:type II toxin-antitoxin system Phd/YefM family antitoxin [Candidatus Palauibacter sp.]|uniref:type II toxin-antitoxin system Phd/YefM family antitoxin n=1 Tax=Candidatus Palauibacter sp. TaxID=3101350 RepID=UPI003B028C71